MFQFLLHEQCNLVSALSHAIRQGTPLSSVVNKGINIQKEGEDKWRFKLHSPFSVLPLLHRALYPWPSDVAGVLGQTSERPGCKKVIIGKSGWEPQTVVLNSIPVSEEYILQNKITSHPGMPHHKVNRRECSLDTNKH